MKYYLFLVLSAVTLQSATICTNVDLAGNYVTHEVNPRRTDPRISAKNNPQFGVVSTEGPWRNQLVVFLPGTGGVPTTFENFCQNAANLGFHAVALTYDNNTSLQTLCGNDPDPDCHFKWRWEILTGLDTTTKTNIGRTNSIEFRLAAFLNYLHTNNPAEGWGQFLVSTNSEWTNALAWDKFFLAGHSQGSDYAAFIAKFYEVQRVSMFAGGDFWFPGLQPANWMFLPSATPPDRWFYYSHLYDMGPFEIPQLEAIGLTQFAAPFDTYGQVPLYGFTHTLTSTMEPCPNVSGNIDYHGATVNDTPQVRDMNGEPLNAEVWTHVLLGPTLPPVPANLLADSVADFSNVQNGKNWRYGYYNRTSDPNGIYNVADFRAMPTFSNSLFAIPAWVVSNDLQVAVWLTGGRPHGVNTNLCCTNRAAGPELWPVRRWMSTIAGPMIISGNLAKWDTGGDGVTGMIKLNGVTIWSATVDGTNIFGTNYSVAVNVPAGSFIDFMLVPGANADQDGARFTAQIILTPPYAPVLYIAGTDLYWFASSNHSYYVEQSTNLRTWAVSGLPIAAPNTDSWITNTITADASSMFFRLRCDLLTNSPVPTVPGVYLLAVSMDNLARTYRLNIPSNYNAAVPAPLVFMLHGGGQTANEIAAMHPSLAHHANTNDMILVMPQSTHNERQTGWSSVDPEPGQPYVDDVNLIVGLIDHLDASLNIDRARIYSAGFSAGGVMSHYLASRTTNVFAAITACGSSIGGERRLSGVISTNPPPSGPIAAMIINATNDCTRPYYGGENTDGNYQLPAIYAAYHYTNANACSGAPLITTNAFMSQNIFRFEACDSKPGPGVLQPNQVIRHHWQTCAPNTEVVFITLTDGGHLWPDANDNVGFDANLAVIEFFKRH